MLFSRTCLGVDFSDNDIKIVELRKSGEKYEVVQAARLKAEADISAVLKGFVSDTETRASGVVVSLPSHECSVKFAALPKAKPAEMARMARYEAETQIPLSLADLVWGYSAYKPAKGEELSHTVIAGARRTVVEGIVSLLGTAGLAPSSAMVSSLAEVQSFRKAFKQHDVPVLLIDVGETWTSLTTVSAGRVTSCRSARLGVADLADAVTSDLSLTPADARMLMDQRSVFEAAVPVDGKSDSQAVERWVEALLLEIRRCLLASAPGLQTQSIRSALVLGDGAALPGLAEVLARRTGLSMEIGNPWAGMTFSTAVAHSKLSSPAVFAVATGLARAGLERGNSINLMPRERAEEESRQRREMTVAAALGGCAIALLVVTLLGSPGIRAKSAELDDLRMRVKVARRDSTNTQPAMRSTVSVMTNVLKEAQDKKDGPVEILLQLSKNLPRSSWLTECRYQSGKTVVLRGSALSNSAVADIVYALSSSGAFQSVALDYSHLGRNSSQQGYDFQIKCALPANASLAQLSKRSKSAKERIVVR